MRFLILFALWLGVISVAYSSTPLEQNIQRLLDEVAASECQFLRNGKSYDGSEGAEHIERKYRHYEDDVDSIDTFIQLAATKSMMSGKEYEVRCGEDISTSASWLHGKADELGLKL